MRIGILLAILCPALCLAQAGRNKNNTAPLTIGDTLPSGLLNPRLQTLKSKPTSAGLLPPLLGGGRGEAPKLIILEFFATWCTSCIKSLRLSDSLQQLYRGQLQFWLISTTATADNENTVAAFFRRHRRRNGTAYNFPTVVNDTVLHARFPHTAVPHYVWLNGDRRVLAITGADELTPANIEAALSGKPLSLPLKNDFPHYQPALPLLVEGNGGSAADLRFSANLTGYLPNLGTGSRYQADSFTRRLTLLNHSILEAYQYALDFPANRIILEAKEESRFYNTGLPAAAWKKNLYGIELTLPAATEPAEMLARLHQFLNASFGLNGRIEKRWVPCWVLTGTAGTLPPSRGGKRNLRWGTPEEPLTCLQNAPLSRLVEALNSQLIGLPLLPIVVNETGIHYNVDLELAAPLTNLPALRKELQRYGLGLVQASRELDMFVLSDEPPVPPGAQTGTKHNDE